VARVNERSESDAREMPWTLRGDVAEQMRNHTLREVIRLYPVGDSQALQFGYEAPVPPDHASYQSFMAKVVEPALFAVALARGINEREIAWLAGRFNLLVFRQIKGLQRHRDFLGETNAHETTCRDCVAVAHKASGFFGAGNLSAVRRT
jgi:hypothetical protein